MRKFTLLLVLLLFGGIQAVLAQRTISGVITSSQDGSAIPGVTILVKEATKVGTLSDLNGKYSLKVPANAKNLRITFIGMKTKEVALTSNNTLNVSLDPDVTQLEGVVVTAIGIKRSEKSLGYSATSVKTEDLTAARNTNVMSGITGKVAGVSVSNSGGPGGSTKVIIRGTSSFTDNQPLYVIDGVPINNNFQGTSSFSQSVDFGNQANDIDPENIESVTILKGASATALYGSRAAHGVIMITSKSGKKNDKIKVSYTSTFNLSEVLRTPQQQNVFGQGWGLFAYEENGNWGPKMDGKIREWGAEVDGKRLSKPFSSNSNSLRDFYETGQEAVNSVNISAGNDHSTFFASYSNATQNGVIPGNADKFKRNAFSFRGTTKYDKFSADYSVNYIRRDVNAVSAGQGTSDGGSTLYQELLQIPGSINITDLKDYKNKYNNGDNYFTPYAENPYFVINENGNKLQDDRVFGKVELSYDIIPGLKAIGRLGGDFSNTRQKSWGAIVDYTPGSLSANFAKKSIIGRYEEYFFNNGQVDANFLLQGDYKVNSDISINGVAGVNYNQRVSNSLDSYVSGLNIPEWYSLQNTNNTPVTASLTSKRRLIGAFAQAEMSFRNYWFVNVSGRNDWSSTLPIDNHKNSFFYGGVNTSVTLTDMFKDLKSNALSFMKVRAAWGQTGNDAPVYRTSGSYLPTQIGLGFGNLFLPLNGVTGLTLSNTLGNLDLKPEISTELEFGIDSRFFNNRIGLDLAYYDKNTKNQIISANLSPETGYTAQTLNVGKIENKGIEARLSVVPIETKNWRWELATTFTKNKSTVKELYGDVKDFLISSAYSVNYIARVGEPLGTFTVPQVQTVTSGPYAGYTVVQANGVPKIDPNTTKNVGTSQPDFIMGFSNKITFKNFTLTTVVDWRKGGKFYSYTAQLMNFVGSSTETTFNERQPFLVPHSVKETTKKDANGNTIYAENDIPITFTGNYNYWYANTNNAMYEHAILKKDYVKLREVTLTYTLPKSITSKLHVSALDFSLIGRNLLLFTPKSNNFVDPEGTNYGNDLGSEFGEFATGPTMRTYGASLRITF
jgi:TonB-linked SusC/RagA family outer membrane protein